jgi:hypothetical protein
MPNLRARCAVALARRFPGAFAQAAIGDNILYAGATGNVMDFIQQPQAQNRANPRHCAPQVERVGGMLRGRVEDGQLHIAEQLVVVANQREVDCDTLLHGGRGKPPGHTVAVRLIGEFLANLGPVILAVRILHGREQLGPFAHQRHPTPEQIPGARIGAG